MFALCYEYDFRRCCQEIRDIVWSLGQLPKGPYLDNVFNIKISKLVKWSISKWSFICGCQNYQLVKIWNSLQFLEQPRNGQNNNNNTIIQFWNFQGEIKNSSLSDSVESSLTWYNFLHFFCLQNRQQSCLLM